MTDFANAEGTSWHDVAEVVYECMCPDTGRACHSSCVCHRFERGAVIEPSKRREYAEAGAPPFHVATCSKYGTEFYD